MYSAPGVTPEIYELDYKHAIVTALLISFDACYAPSAPAGSVFLRDVLVDKLRGTTRLSTNHTVDPT